MGHLAFQQEHILLPESVKRHRHSKAPVTAHRHRIGPLDLLAGVQQRRTGILLVGEGVATDFHASKAVLRVGVFRQRFHIGFQPGDKALIFFDLLREGFQQLVLQPVLLALVVGLQQLQPGHVHIQIHALLDARVPGAQRLDLRKGQRRLVHIVAAPHRRFGGHDL